MVVRRRDRLLLMQCGPQQWWTGLWDFPRFPLVPADATELRQQLVEGVHRLTGARVEPGKRLATLKHGVTRYRITLDCHEARLVSQTKRDEPPLRWLRPDELAHYPLSATGRKLSRLLGE